MSATDRSKQPSVLSFKYSAIGTARSMPAYDDGSTPMLITGTLAARADSSPCADRGQNMVAVDFRHGEASDADGATGTIQAKSTGGYSLNYMPGATDGYIVRRLTPVECERLQGFPDGWTDLAGADPEAIASRMPQYADADDRGKRALVRKVEGWCADTPDGPRYKACGNSMAVPNMRWIFERIAAYDTLAETPVG